MWVIREKRGKTTTTPSFQSTLTNTWPQVSADALLHELVGTNSTYAYEHPFTRPLYYLCIYLLCTDALPKLMHSSDTKNEWQSESAIPVALKSGCIIVITGTASSVLLLCISCNPKHSYWLCFITSNEVQITSLSLSFLKVLSYLHGCQLEMKAEWSTFLSPSSIMLINSAATSSTWFWADTINNGMASRIFQNLLGQLKQKHVYWALLWVIANHIFEGWSMTGRP